MHADNSLSIPFKSLDCVERSEMRYTVLYRCVWDLPLPMSMALCWARVSSCEAIRSMVDEEYTKSYRNRSRLALPVLF
jgi:hypothetical protein